MLVACSFARIDPTSGAFDDRYVGGRSADCLTKFDKLGSLGSVEVCV